MCLAMSQRQEWQQTNDAGTALLAVGMLIHGRLNFCSLLFRFPLYSICSTKKTFVSCFKVLFCEHYSAFLQRGGQEASVIHAACNRF